VLGKWLNILGVVSQSYPSTYHFDLVPSRYGCPRQAYNEYDQYSIHQPIPSKYWQVSTCDLWTKRTHGIGSLGVLTNTTITIWTCTFFMSQYVCLSRFNMTLTGLEVYPQKILICGHLHMFLCFVECKFLLVSPMVRGSVYHLRSIWNRALWHTSIRRLLVNLGLTWLVSIYWWCWLF
jgi:hypothetical protein